ncbi:hypothetical protein NDU88_001060 [Pleurodeles waltl]|uniref:4Fe-4S ferredoxin-type domain-containing protein n=1 Tax=Pleurodeles waltl TaxID=8319 RepID=A0AAV7TH74_PLEWA|nr:hypothetical protein NDU88_001060 [Pleurodeles waltl]
MLRKCGGCGVITCPASCFPCVSPGGGSRFTELGRTLERRRYPDSQTLACAAVLWRPWGGSGHEEDEEEAAGSGPRGRVAPGYEGCSVGSVHGVAMQGETAPVRVCDTENKLEVLGLQNKSAPGSRGPGGTGCSGGKGWQYRYIDPSLYELSHGAAQCVYVMQPRKQRQI